MILLLSILAGNAMVLFLMAGFSLAWNALAGLGGRRVLSRPDLAYRLDRAAWSAFYWPRARTYLISYAVVLAVLIFMPLALGRPGDSLVQARSLAQLLPGLAVYFLMAGSIPARFAFYPEGIRCLALIPFLPGKREKKTGMYAGFRVGLRFWREFRDASVQNGLLVLRGERFGLEIPVPADRREHLLGLAREGIKKARAERRRTKRGESR